jgi:hypothetical protein
VRGATLAIHANPDRGFIDTPLAFDGAGGRLAYVHTDAAELRDLVIVDLASKGEISRVPLPAIAATPVALGFVGGGDRYLVVARAGEDRVVAVVLDGAGKVIRKHGPAGEIHPVRYDERPALSLYTRSEKLKGKDAGLRHVIEVFDLDSGKRLGKKRELRTDFDLKLKKPELAINHWLDGYTVAVGMLAGEYDRARDQRAPDAEGWYDVPRGVLARRLPIADVLAHLKLRALLARHPNERVFARVSDDRRRLERVSEGVIAPVELAEPFHHYDPGSLAYQVAGGTLFAALTIDPVHPDAAARKKAVPVWTDLYAIAAGPGGDGGGGGGGGKARRRARLRPEGAGVRWLASAQHWAVVPRHVGFERGGPELFVYALP